MQMGLVRGQSCFMCACVLVLCTSSASAAEFLDKRNVVAVSEIKAELELTLHQAMTHTIGANSLGQNAALADIESQLTASFKALPKNNLGLLDQAALHHLVNNRFIKENGWYVKGLEPQSLNRSVDTNETAGILTATIPLYIEQLLGARNEGGFGLHHAVAMVTTLEHLIINEGVALLDSAYRMRGFDPDDHLEQDQMGDVLDSYLVLYLLGGDPTNKTMHFKQLAAITRIFPTWGDAQMFVRDVFKDTLFSARLSANPFTDDNHFFEHAWQALDAASRKFGKFQNSECQDMKAALTSMDPESTGRVSLRDFYRKLLEDAFPFSESAEYLRDLGALDESTPASGPQVIISNYLSSMNNCIMTNAHYSICCVDECIGLLNSIEARIAAPSANPGEILALVEHMSSSTVLAPRNLSMGLRQALDKVAELHDGKVPLHGRLFRQWMHYAFPHECQYPHTSTSGITTLTPQQFKGKTGNMGFVTKDEFKQVLKSSFSGSVVQMSQWTMEEELHISTPQDHENGVWSFIRRAMQVVLVMAVAFALWGKVDRMVSLSRAAPKSKEYLV